MGSRKASGWGLHRLVSALLVFAVVMSTRVIPGSTDGPAHSAAIAPRNDWYGIAHVSYSSNTASSRRYDEAAQIGVGWNRWALYWHEVETSPGQFDFSRVDATVDLDRSRELNILAVLMGTPGSYMTAGVMVAPPRLEDKHLSRLQREVGALNVVISSATSAPHGLYAPTFADGTDTYAPGKQPNPNNPWARFVYTTVSRYRNQIKHWEMWNEPDFSVFWSGTVAEYVRLLQVGYLAAKSADPDAVILVGGMMYWEWANRYNEEHAWLRRFLDELVKVPNQAANNNFFHGIPWHWYSRPSDVLWRTARARDILAEYGISGKEMWVNESNVPACGEPPLYVSCAGWDYPGGATADEQASFMIQAVTYGLAVNLDRFIMFQHQDDGVGESFGLFRNNATPRPAYASYGVANRYLTNVISTTRTVQGDFEKFVVRTVRDGVTYRVTVLWKRNPGNGVINVPAAAASAILVDQTGAEQTIYPSNGSYSVALAGATNNRNFDGNPNDYVQGGRPRLLVELDGDVPSFDGLIVNGGFESSIDFEGWTRGGSTLPIITSTSYRGTRAALLGANFQADPGIGDGQGGNSTISQTVQLPGNQARLELSFFYRLTTAEPAPADQGDWSTWNDRFEVIVVDAANQTHYEIVEWSGTDWRLGAIDLTRFAGQRITVIFNVWQSSADRPTTVVIDEVDIGPSLPHRIHLPNVRR